MTCLRNKCMSASHIYSPMFSSESFMISDNVYRHSVMPDSLWPHGLQPTRLLRPWDFPGKSTGVGWHFLLQRMKVKSESEAAQSCPTLRDPMDFSPPGSSAHGIFQARALEWGAIAFSILVIETYILAYLLFCSVPYWPSCFIFPKLAVTFLIQQQMLA